MYEDLEEVRYPFDNLVEFISGGYWTQREALHLVLGWVFLGILVAVVLRCRGVPRHFRLSILYFALALFTNPAYNILGLSVNEVFGLCAIAAMTFSAGARAPALAGASPVTLGLFAVFFAGLVHNVFAAMLYPELNREVGILAVRLALNFKIVVLAMNLLIVGHTLSRGMGVHFLIKSIVAAGVFGAAMYLLQGALLVSGTVPYGTFIDAGFVGVPSFGSVSVERGHFGKFMAPLFPFFLYALLANGWRWRFAVFVLVSCINFSASGLAFFLSSSLLAALIFRRRIRRSAFALVALVAMASAVAAIFVAYWEVFVGVGEKIYEIAIQGDESTGGGRSFGTFLQYVTAYPLGIGYSGSTLRTAPGLPEINAAHFAFVTQYSFLALPILLAYFLLVWRTLAVARQRNGWRDLRRSMSVGIISSLLIFATDILWFVPTIWLSFEFVWALRARRWPYALSSEPSEAGPLPLDNVVGANVR